MCRHCARLVVARSSRRCPFKVGRHSSRPISSPEGKIFSSPHIVADVVQLQNDILQLATTVDALKSISAIEHKFFKQKVEASEAKIKTLEYQFADFKAEVQTPKAEAGKDGVDCVELFAASKVENEKLKKNLTNTVTEKVVLEQQVAELRKKLSE